MSCGTISVTFKDAAMTRAIMGTTDPIQHKKLGRKVSNFDPKVWGRKSVLIVKEGSKLKVLHLYIIMQHSVYLKYFEAYCYI